MTVARSYLGDLKALRVVVPKIEASDQVQTAGEYLLRPGLCTAKPVVVKRSHRPSVAMATA